jgi:hypothetical protein
MKTARMPRVTFTDDPFRTAFTFQDLRAATLAVLPGMSLLAAAEVVRRKRRGDPPPEVVMKLAQRSKCPSCVLSVSVGDIRTVPLSNGKTVKLYVHKSVSGDGVGRVCRVEG